MICVHDAARPLATTALFRRVIAAVSAGADGAVPAVPVADTIKIVGADDVVCSTPDRATLVAVQTPQAFRADALRTAHAGGDEGTDDASLVERRGGRVVTVEGEAANRKITTPADLEWAHAGLAGAESRAPSVDVRVGNGFDVHRSGDDAARPLVLGGCVFPGLPGLVGHSDGDAVAHAVADALLGAAGLGDLGELFPDTAAEWAGADSVGLLAQVVERVRAEGWRVGNADCSVVCEAPKLAPRARRDAAPPRRRARRSGQREGAPAGGPRGARARRGRPVPGLGGAHAGDGSGRLVSPARAAAASRRPASRRGQPRARAGGRASRRARERQAGGPQADRRQAVAQANRRQARSRPLGPLTDGCLALAGGRANRWRTRRGWDARRT